MEHHPGMQNYNSGSVSGDIAGISGGEDIPRDNARTTITARIPGCRKGSDNLEATKESWAYAFYKGVKKLVQVGHLIPF